MTKNKSHGFFITGTDTGIGKTLVSIGLALSLKADYWKVIQAGKPTDSDEACKFLENHRVHPPAYTFNQALSPNQAAKKENKKIDLNKIQVPKSNLLIVEGVGGAFVPLSNTQSQLDLILKLGFPSIVVAKSGLGTLNQSLSTLEILKLKSIKVLALILCGEPHPLNKKDLQVWSDVPIIWELPPLKNISNRLLLKTFNPLSKKLKKYC